ncbi:MAG: hypothetical protein ACRYFS_19545 [Janthinobacterium lividum]
MADQSNPIIDDFPSQFLRLNSKADDLNSKMDDLSDRIKQLQEDAEKQAERLSCIGLLFAASCEGNQEKIKEAIRKLKLSLI